MIKGITCRSKIEEGKVVKITVAKTGVVFRVGRGLYSMADQSVICDFEQAEKMLEVALTSIRLRKKNG